MLIYKTIDTIQVINEKSGKVITEIKSNRLKLKIIGNLVSIKKHTRDNWFSIQPNEKISIVMIRD